MSKVLAKFRVYSIEETERDLGLVGEPVRLAKRIRLAAMQGGVFGPATPHGDIDIVLMDAGDYTHFRVGNEYFVTFEEDVEEEMTEDTSEALK